jgi:hypothetical protein
MECVSVSSCKAAMYLYALRRARAAAVRVDMVDSAYEIVAQESPKPWHLPATSSSEHHASGQLSDRTVALALPAAGGARPG